MRYAAPGRGLASVRYGEHHQYSDGVRWKAIFRAGGERHATASDTVITGLNYHRPSNWWLPMSRDQGGNISRGAIKCIDTFICTGAQPAGYRASAKAVWHGTCAWHGVARRNRPSLPQCSVSPQNSILATLATQSACRFL